MYRFEQVPVQVGTGSSAVRQNSLKTATMDYAETCWREYYYVI
jgi:uncharacterized protein YbdZ (MbtH family)